MSRNFLIFLMLSCLCGGVFGYFVGYWVQELYQCVIIMVLAIGWSIFLSLSILKNK